MSLQEINIREPDDNLIDCLETLLGHAITGELTGLVFVSQWQDSSVNSGWRLATPKYMRTIIGEMECVKTQLIANDGVIDEVI